MTDSTQPPTKTDINVHDSLDEIAAKDHFLGKTVDEAELLFRENSAYYQDDLMWMGPRAYEYYLQSVVNYLKSPQAAGDTHIISCMYSVIRFRAEESGFELGRESVGELVDYVIGSYEKFDVNPDVYGDLLSQYEELKSELETAP